MVNGKLEPAKLKSSIKGHLGILPPNQLQPLKDRCAGQQRVPGAERSKKGKGELLLVLRVKLSNEGQGKKENQHKGENT